MAIDNPHEPATEVTPLETELPAPSVVTHAGNSKEPDMLEVGVQDFGTTTIRGAVADKKLDPKAVPDTVASIPEHDEIVESVRAKAAPEKKSRKKLFVAIGSAVTAAAITLTAVFALGGDSDSSSKKAKTAPSALTSPESPNSATPNIANHNPEVVVPNSDDPAILARQLYTNYVNYLNTGDIKFLELWVPNINSDLGLQAQQRRSEVAQYQAQSHPNYHLVYPEGDEGIKVVSDQTDFTSSTQRTLTVDVHQEEFLDNRSATPSSDGWYRMRLTLNPYDRADGKEWLPSFSVDLGTPPASAPSGNVSHRPF